MCEEVKEVNCKNFISSNYFGLISDGKKGQCKACGCTYVSREFCSSGECEIKEEEVCLDECNT